MKRFATIGMLLLSAAIVTADVVIAQQGGGGGRRRGGGGGVNAALILGTLAFDTESNVTDAQLIQVRNALKPLHQKQQDLLRSVRSGERDFQEVREDMTALRGELLEALSSVLSAQQVDRVKEVMQRQGNRGQRGRRGGGGGGR